MSKLTNTAVFAGCPNTYRGIPCHISADDAGKFLSYGCGNNVVVRHLNNNNNNDVSEGFVVCTRHTVPVTCSRLSPSGALCASGDRDGTVIVWVVRADTMEKLHFKPITGAVRDISWSDDQERIVVCGEGRSGFAGVYTITGCNSVGNIQGHQKPIMSCDFRKQRPLRIVTGSQDSHVAFFEGLPLKFKHTVSGFKGTVACTRFSPDGNLVACVSSAAEVVLLEGETGNKVQSFPIDHENAVLSVTWSRDGLRLATASLDRKVKVWNVADGSKVGESAAFSTGLSTMLLGCTFLPDGRLVTVNLGGDITFLDATFLTPCGVVWAGHSRPVVAMAQCAALSNRFVTVGVDSKVYAWDVATGAATTLVTIPNDNEVDVLAASVLPDGTLIAVTSNDLLRCDLIKGAITKLATKKDGAVALVVTSSGCIVVLQKSAVMVYTATGELNHEEKMQRFDGSSIAVHDNTIAVGGDKEVRVFSIEGSLMNLLGKFTQVHTNSVVTALAFSDDGRFVASGDAGRQIAVWSTNDYALVHDDLQFHTSRITSLMFNRIGDKLVSAGMDGSIVVWDLNNKKNAKKDFCHRNGVYVVGFDANDNGVVFSAGADAAVKLWKYEFN